MSISRRSFLKGSAAATALSMAGGAAKKVMGKTTGAAFKPGPGNKWPGRVVVNFNKDAVSGTTIGTDQIAVIKKMVDDSIMALAEKSNVGEAWKAVFPSSLTKDAKIAIKTNFYATSKCRIHWSVVQAMTEGLQKMDFNGTPFPPSNITIFEANVPQANTMDGAGYTAANFPGIARNIDTKSMVTNVNDAAPGETSGYASSLKNADFFLHVYGIRGHSNQYAEGVTLGGKSHYGTYSNAKMVHSSPAFSVRCANMMASGVVYNKLVLSVSAGLLSNNKGAGINDAPADYSTYAKKMDPNCTTKATSTIIMSTDPVTTDMQAVKVMQMNTGSNYGVSDMPKYLQATAGVSGALSGVSYNIGKIDEKDMTIAKIINGSGTTMIGGAEASKRMGADYSLRVSPFNGQGIVFVDYIVPASRQGDRAVLSMYEMRGNLVFSKEQTIHGVANQFAWDRKTAQGKALARGKYVCRLTIGKINRSATFSII